MRAWTDAQLSLTRARMQERQREAATARLGAMARSAAGGPRPGLTTGLRGAVGRALIRAGQFVAPETTVTRGHRRIAARQP